MTSQFSRPGPLHNTGNWASPEGDIVCEGVEFLYPQVLNLLRYVLGEIQEF